MLLFNLAINSSLLKVLQVLATSMIKFTFGPFLAVRFDFNFIQTFITVSIGGIAGVIVYYLLSEWLVIKLDHYQPLIIKFWKTKIIRHKNPDYIKPKKIFTKRNRRIVRIISKYGMFGLSILTPILLTLPLGTFLAIRFFPHKENILLYLSLGVIFWAFMLSLVAVYI